MQHGANYFHNAKIMHYVSTSKKKYEPFYNTLPLRVKERGYLSKEDLSLIAEPFRYFGSATFIITGNDYEIYRSNIGSLTRNLYRRKFLFKLTDKIFDLLKIIKNKLVLRKKYNKKYQQE
jgi:hypothetical protein